jgi:pterin-4a-carbinolamine dehydratase
MAVTEPGPLIGNLIFLSYRRNDTAAHTLAIRLELATRLQAAQIFVDTHTIQAGAVWPHQIEDALHLAKTIIPVIGKSWLGSESKGKRRIDDPADWVHRELKIALEKRKTAIVPVLVDGAPALKGNELPDPLHELAEIQPVKIDLDQWDTDIHALVQLLKSRFGFESKTQRYEYPVPDPFKAKTIAIPWDELEAEVGRELGDWRIEFSDDSTRLHYKRVELVRDFQFKSFEKAMAFMQETAKHANEIDHHPRWMNLWCTVTVWLSTWDAGHRVTVLDVALARYLERKYHQINAAPSKKRSH